MGIANGQFDFEVAFSFLQQDEATALKLNDLLQPRMATFIYSEQQKLLAGADGEATFNRVFGDQARSVAIIYREGWGETPWTRIEQTAIRNRAHEWGYDFALFVSLDGSKMPPWVPKNRIWIGFERWGPDATAAVIEQRVAELGGDGHTESLEEAAARLARQATFALKEKRALESIEGVNAFRSGKAALFSSLAQAAERINKNQDHFNLSTVNDENNGRFFIQGLPRTITVSGGPRYANILDGAKIRAVLWDHAPAPPGYMNLERPQEGKAVEFKLGYIEGDKYVWLGQGDRRFSIQALADHILKWGLDNA